MCVEKQGGQKEEGRKHLFLSVPYTRVDRLHDRKKQKADIPSSYTKILGETRNGWKAEDVEKKKKTAWIKKVGENNGQLRFHPPQQVERASRRKANFWLPELDQSISNQTS